MENVRTFRNSRIAHVFSDEIFIPLNANGKILLHLIPVDAFNPLKKFDLHLIEQKLIEKLTPISLGSLNWRYTFDGFVKYGLDDNGPTHFSYAQFFRGGIIEAMDGSLLEPDLSEPHEKYIFPSYEKRLIKAVTQYLKVLKEMEVGLPIFVFVSLLNVKHYSMNIDKNKHYYEEPNSIDRDVLMLPEVLIENFDVDVPHILKPIFDTIWNACGYSRSRNYNSEGNWID